MNNSPQQPTLSPAEHAAMQAHNAMLVKAQQRQRLAQQVNSGGGWFYIIAALSLVNSAVSSQ
jgi:hypothetical protein